MSSIDRRAYVAMYGPTTGDRVSLGDTGLVIEVERDLTSYGDECKFGGGKVLRDQMGQMPGANDDTSLDVVITNALIVDWTGIYKADVGIKGGRIVGKSDEIGAYPVERPVKPNEIVATIYRSLGLNLETHLPGPNSRPYPLVDFGTQAINELF